MGLPSGPSVATLPGIIDKIMKVPFSTPSESVFLELVFFSPIKVAIKVRRANYLHYALKRNQD
jgi:hypothetical protein